MRRMSSRLRAARLAVSSAFFRSDRSVMPPKMRVALPAAIRTMKPRFCFCVFVLSLCFFWFLSVLFCVLPAFWMDAVRPRITARKKVVRPPSEQRSQPLVPAKLVGLEMIVPDRIGSGLDQASEAFLAFAQCLLRPLALGDVGDIPFQREQHARFVIHSGALLPHPLLAAIGSDQPVRDLKTAARIDRDPDFVPDVFTVSRMDEFRIPDLPVS